VNTNKCECVNKMTTIRARRMLKFFDELAAKANALFAARHQASEGGGEGDGDQRSGDSLPGVLDAVLVQALAFQPPFWIF
jgi:hypothetical protein